ncbi:MAG: undecaprenyldiphospho-muramoylpentapeptide beta-N-acetylglucosaminyltransferase [Coriobacteriales bacterium]|nr:undecaprenyldiphospho-muramoylpentapeptide beta-N-acetylglucosaminyltransferase [Coriobacteriales bacterium]
MTRKLEVAIAAGGTAGHINPALALAEELTDRGHHVTFYGQEHKLEGTLVPQAGYDFSKIVVTGFDRSAPWTLVSAMWRMSKAKRVLASRFKQTGAPDVAIGFGAYVELPLLSLCRKRRIPYVIHEQNSVPGLANKTSARGAAAVCVAFPGACAAFEGAMGKNTQLVVTGNPVRRSVVDASRAAGREAFGMQDDQTMLLVFGGSLGARHVNNALVGLKDHILLRKDVRVVHSTGNELYDEVAEALALTDEEAKRWQLMPYITNMGEALAAADLVVSRAGASSIAEIAALAVPSVLVPYPLATADHQTTNARLLSDAGAAVLVPDDKLDSAEFSGPLLDALDHADVRDAMRTAARNLAQDKAAAVLADEVEKVAD